MYFNNLMSVTAGDPEVSEAHVGKFNGRLRLIRSVLRVSELYVFRTSLQLSFLDFLHHLIASTCFDIIQATHFNLLLKFFDPGSPARVHDQNVYMVHIAHSIRYQNLISISEEVSFGIYLTKFGIQIETSTKI